MTNPTSKDELREFVDYLEDALQLNTAQTYFVRNKTKELIEATSQRARLEELESLTGCPPILVEATINDRIAALSKKGQTK